MKKSELKKIVFKLKSVFLEDQEALSLLEILDEKISKLKISDSAVNESTIDQLSILPEEMKEIAKGYAIYSDGACRGNPGPGAWAVIIQNEKAEIILKSSGVDVPTTNNKMELEGVLRGLRGLIEKWVEDGTSDRETPVFIYSDSKYVVDGITSWVPGWKSRGWKKADNKEPENLALWKELDDLKNNFTNIKFIWVKGHAGHPQNEHCDHLCNSALDEAGF